MLPSLPPLLLSLQLPWIHSKINEVLTAAAACSPSSHATQRVTRCFLEGTGTDNRRKQKQMPCSRRSAARKAGSGPKWGNGNGEILTIIIKVPRNSESVSLARRLFRASLCVRLLLARPFSEGILGFLPEVPFPPGSACSVPCLHYRIKTKQNQKTPLSSARISAGD